MTRRTATAIVALLLATAALAGCVGGDDGGTDTQTDGLEEASTNDTETNTSEEAEEPPFVATTSWHNGTMEGASIPNGGWYCTPTSACENTLTFDVPQGTQAILVEAAWEGDANTWFNVSGPNCESAYVLFESCSPATDTSGGSPLAILIEDGRTNATGEWTADVWVDDTTPTQIELTIVATVVEQGSLPQGYSALDAAGGSS